jgi:ATP-dependent 26S proteasome regulatory subunit
MENNFETKPFVFMDVLAGFVKGRNISEANRMIQDIIQYADEENEEGTIVFLDQQKAYDRVFIF